MANLPPILNLIIMQYPEDSNKTKPSKTPSRISSKMIDTEIDISATILNDSTRPHNNSTIKSDFYSLFSTD